MGRCCGFVCNCFRVREEKGEMTLSAIVFLFCIGNVRKDEKGCVQTKQGCERVEESDSERRKRGE